MIQANIFKALGMLGDEYKNQLKDGTILYS